MSLRRRLSWLVIATTSTVVVSFVIPLCLLVRNLAEERAIRITEQEARNVAVAIAADGGNFKKAADRVTGVDQLDQPTTGALREDGATLGDAEGMAQDPEVIKRQQSAGSDTYVDGRGARALVSFFVARKDGELQIVVVRSSVTAADVRHNVYPVWAGIVALGLLLLAMALWLAAGLGRRISQPLLDVAGVAHRLREGDLSARARVRGTEETEELARALNGLADRTVELLEKERAAVGDLSHRLRTPVTALRLDAEGVSDPVLAARLQEHIATLQVTIDSIVSEARRPVRSDLAAVCDAAETVRARVAFWEVLAEDQQRPLRVSVPAVPVRVPLAAEDLADAVDVLIDNVFAHTPDGTPFEVSLSALAGRASLLVVDEGPGLLGAVAGDRPGTTGLGLDIVRRTAGDSGGQLLIGATRSGGADGSEIGTRVELTLPLVEG
ncbi:HAMP domain-containing protein [Nocardioides sp.]|uniref:HAMP domain-containing sensor histidine kinase n=1 Tax=Nocardioides sp. TaxID=35761 RepID=UPI0035278D90